MLAEKPEPDAMEEQLLCDGGSLEPELRSICRMGVQIRRAAHRTEGCDGRDRVKLHSSKHEEVRREDARSLAAGGTRKGKEQILERRQFDCGRHAGGLDQRSESRSEIRA